MKIIRRMSSGYIQESFEDRKELSKEKPIKSLLGKLSKPQGRDNRGRISVRHRGAGAKRLYRIVSTLDQCGTDEIKVIRLEYDPNRSANIALVELKNGSKKYIIAQDKLVPGTILKYSEKINVEIGNRSMLKNIPVGTQVSDIQIYPESLKYIARAAGTYATLMALEGEYALLRLPSGELRKIHQNCNATIGQVSNTKHNNVRIGKAGRKRHMGIRPTVRGKVMSPAAHPHGGGEGVNPIGLKYPKTPWGKIAIGKKTRRSKNSDKYIVKKAKAKR